MSGWLTPWFVAGVSDTVVVVDHFILFYDVVNDYVERRGEFRGLHLSHAKASADRGELRLAGAYADPADGAALVFRCDDEATVREFAEADPYVRNGLVKDWHIRRWTVVVGADYDGPVPGD